LINAGRDGLCWPAGSSLAFILFCISDAKMRRAAELYLSSEVHRWILERVVAGAKEASV
jgi:hypothetical protein